MNRQSLFKRAVFAVALAAPTTSIAEAANVCPITSQDGLNSCKKGAQGDYWNSVGTCVNISDPQSQQACLQKAKSDNQSALTTCQDQFTSRNKCAKKWAPGLTIPRSIPTTTLLTSITPTCL